MQLKDLSATLMLLSAAPSLVLADCIGPAVNQATLDLIKEFEGWYPDICGFHSLICANDNGKCAYY